MSNLVAATPPASLFGVRQVAEQFIKKPPLLLGVILTTLPLVYLVVYGKESAAGVVMLAAMSLWVITMTGGLKVGLVNAPILAVLMALSCLAVGRPLAAGALALIVALWASLGTASGRGMLIAMAASIMTIQIMIPPHVAHTASLHSWSNVAAVFGYAAIASVWGILIGLFLQRGREFPLPPRATWKWGVTQGIMVGVVMAAVAVFATSRNLGQGGAWLLLTTFLVFKPLTPTPWKRSLHRVLGTVLGVAIVAIYLHTLPVSAPTMAILIPAALMSVAAAVTALSQRWPYWCYVALWTPAVILFVATMSSTSKAVSTARYLDTLRIEYSFLGIAVALAAQGLLLGIKAAFHLQESTWFGTPAQADPGGS
jgi:hypothetical protein